jgi:2-methylcitrate dehydratase PrpD
MSTAAETLAAFAAGLKYEDLPQSVVQRARDCITDTVGVCTFGAALPWSRMVAAHAKRYGSGGPCSVMGFPDLRLHAPYAALANGVLGHAFEQDSLRDPGVGAHPGAAIVPAILAVCEERGIDGRTAITAFVAGVEIMFRIGLASHHTPEKIGFHGPGLTGPYAAAAAVGRLLGFDAQRMGDALGIAGSLSSGLLAFSRSQRGAMVKRLHLGRASESGVLAASLAAEGYEGPESVLDGKFGYLEAYCKPDGVEPELLTKGLGDTWETLRICMKRYACHITSHTPVQALRTLMTEHRFGGEDVRSVTVEGGEKLITHHNIPQPADVMQAQYSLPFNLALALYLDPDDAKSFMGGALEDARVLDAAQRMKLRPLSIPAKTGRTTRVIVELRDGRTVEREEHTFKGMPADPLDREALKRKFTRLTAELGEARSNALFDRLANMESLPAFTLS